PALKAGSSRCSFRKSSDRLRRGVRTIQAGRALPRIGATTLEGAVMTSRYAVVLFAALAVLGLASVSAAPVRAQDMDTPGIASIPAGTSRASLTITAGPSGAPAGFTVWWMKESDYV